MRKKGNLSYASQWPVDSSCSQSCSGSIWGVPVGTPQHMCSSPCDCHSMPPVVHCLWQDTVVSHRSMAGTASKGFLKWAAIPCKIKVMWWKQAIVYQNQPTIERVMMITFSVKACKRSFWSYLSQFLFVLWDFFIGRFLGSGACHLIIQNRS